MNKFFTIIFILLISVFGFLSKVDAAEILQVTSSSILLIGDNNRTYTVKIACMEISPNLEERAFKEETPAHIQQAMLEHIATTEYAMIEKAQTSPLFESKLAQLPLFPIFPNGFMARSREQQTMVVQGETNRGAEITGQIPGEENIDLGDPFENKISGGGQSPPKAKGSKV